jgi:hypothetical protein
VHGISERRDVVPGGQVGLDRLECCVAGVQHRPVVPIGRSQGWVVEPLGQQPALVGQRPGVPTPPGPAVAQQELRQAMPGPGAIFDDVGAGPAQVADRLLLDAGDADRYQLPGPVQPR